LMLQRVEIWSFVLLDAEIWGLVLPYVTLVDKFVMASRSTLWNSLAAGSNCYPSGRLQEGGVLMSNSDSQTSHKYSIEAIGGEAGSEPVT
jgi:hypothetical protein